MKDISNYVRSGDLNKKASPKELEALNSVLKGYAASVEDKDSKTASIGRKIFGTAKKLREAKAVSKQLDSILSTNTSRKSALIEHTVRELKETATTDPQQAKIDAKKFILDMAKGVCPVLPQAMDDTINELLAASDDNKVKDLLQSADLFSSYEIKTGNIQERENPIIREKLIGKLAEAKEKGDTTIFKNKKKPPLRKVEALVYLKI